jgi:predicted N-acetyltransferase YhbS
MSKDIRTCRPEELERLIALLDEEFIFGKGRTISLQQRFPAVYCRNNLHNLVVCAEDGQIASALAMRQFDWREGEEIFRGAMIGAVYTHPSRRGEGLASRVLEAAAMRLREDGIDFGVLWTGQQPFYARLGWVSADCGMLGELEPDEQSGLMPEPSGDVTRFPVETIPPRLEDIRPNLLNTMTLRRPEDYRQLPLPAERVDVLWCEDQGKVAYALIGGSGATGFLYELVGDAACFPALWRESCRGHQRIFINDQTGSPSCRWLTEHTGITWQRKNLAMWLPLSKRVDISRLGQWYIPYFDRI